MWRREAYELAYTAPSADLDVTVAKLVPLFPFLRRGMDGEDQVRCGDSETVRR